MKTYGIRVAKPGKRADSPIPTDLVMTTEFPSVPIALEIPIDLSGNNGNSKLLIVKHNQTFVPVILVYYVLSSDPTHWQWAPQQGSSFLRTIGETQNNSS